MSSNLTFAPGSSNMPPPGVAADIRSALSILSATEVSDAIDSAVAQVTAEFVRRRKVLDVAVTTDPPPTEVSGDRYLLIGAGAAHASWDDAAENDIVEFDGSAWIAYAPDEGWRVYVEAENADRVFVDDGTPTWEERDNASGGIAALESSTDRAVPVFDGVGGATLAESALSVDGSANMSLTGGSGRGFLWYPNSGAVVWNNPTTGFTGTLQLGTANDQIVYIASYDGIMPVVDQPSVVNNSVVRFDGTDGERLQPSLMGVTDSGDMTVEDSVSGRLFEMRPASGDLQWENVTTGKICYLSFQAENQNIILPKRSGTLLTDDIFNPQTLTSAATITPDWEVGPQCYLALAHNTELQLPLNMPDGAGMQISGTMSGAGGYSFALATGYKDMAAAATDIGFLSAGDAFDITIKRVGAEYRVFIVVEA